MAEPWPGMATGVPVIGSRRGGIPEMIDHGIDGILVDDPEDSKGLAEQISTLLENPQRRFKMGHRARQKIVQKFTAEIRSLKSAAYYTHGWKRTGPMTMALRSPRR